MAFFILAVSRDGGRTWDDDFSRQYDTGADAQERVKTLNGRYSSYRYRVRKVVDTDDDNFYAREAAKNLTPITTDNLPKCETWNWPAWRLPHIDPKNPKQIRFFRDLEDAVSEHYTSMRMPRFFSTICGFDEPHFMDKLVELNYYDGDAEFKILRDADEIEQAYVNGPTSCMNDEEEYPLGDIHPARVYASPDLGLAVLMRGNDCVARTVCWPNKKIYGRVYGHEKLLKDFLAKAGYQQKLVTSPWIGARLIKIWDANEGEFVCPYLDISDTVSEARDGVHLRIAGGRGKYSSKECNGYTYTDRDYAW